MGYLDYITICNLEESDLPKMLSKYFKDLLRQLTKVPFFATQSCHATSSRHEPFHISRVCTCGFFSHGGCPQPPTVHFATHLPSLQHPTPGSNYSCCTRGRLHSGFTVTGSSPAHPLLVFLVSWGLSAADCLYHTFRLLSGLVTKMLLPEFNSTLIPNHTFQGPKLLAEESML